MAAVVTFVFVFLITYFQSAHSRFEPSWDSLDKHVAPSWYDEAKIGIFMHWGAYSVPSYGVYNAGSEWFWERWKRSKVPSAIKFMEKNYAPTFQYQDFAPQFTAEFFNASEWADLIAESGAKYYILTSKHHEGFTMWRSNSSWNWNAVDVGPHRDIVDELATAIRSRTKVHFGLYFSLFEWFHPLFLYDSQNKFKTQEYVKTVSLPQLMDLVKTYKPEYIWSDGDPAPPEYWMSKEFLAWLYNDSPVKDNILVNDRWGSGTSCKHGDVKNCADRFVPHSKVMFKWENAMTLDKRSWGYRRQMNIQDVYDMPDLLSLLARTISTGGNLLINVGPTHDGRIVPIFQERLKQLGSWLKMNGDAVYSTKMWRVQNDTTAHKVWYTVKDEVINAIFLDWSTTGTVTLHSVIPTSNTIVMLNGNPNKLMWHGKVGTPGMQIDISKVQQPCKWAWSLKIINAA